MQGTTTCRHVPGWASTTSTKRPNGLATVTRRKPSRSTTERPCVCASCRCYAISRDGQHPSAWQLSVLSPTLTLPERFYVLDARVFWPPHLCLWTRLGAPGGAESLVLVDTHLISMQRLVCTACHICLNPVRCLFSFSIFTCKTNICLEKKKKNSKAERRKQLRNGLRVGCE